jgi:hypothetical protein
LQQHATVLRVRLRVRRVPCSFFSLGGGGTTELLLSLKQLYANSLR